MLARYKCFKRKMKKVKVNQIDILIESLAKNFAKINDFNKLLESEEGLKLFEIIVQSTSEMETFQSLFLNYYIPASNKSIADTWGQISKSKYRSLLNISKDDLKDNLYETIRLGYVGLFHKYESYLKALVDAVNFLLKELNEECDLLNVQDYCKKEFGINIFKSHDIFPITKRINYISNCIKHYDGFPIKEPVHPEFKYSDPKEKIKINKDIFKSDIDRLKLHCELLLSQVIAIGFKQYFELDYRIIQKSLKPELKDNPETKDKILKVMNSFNLILSDFKK